LTPENENTSKSKQQRKQRSQPDSGQSTPQAKSSRAPKSSRWSGRQRKAGQNSHPSERADRPAQPAGRGTSEQTPRSGRRPGRQEPKAGQGQTARQAGQPGKSSRRPQSQIKSRFDKVVQSTRQLKSDQQQQQNRQPPASQRQQVTSQAGKSAATRSGAAAAAIARDGVLRVIPLGGMREIGKNMFALEYGNDMIIIDCGIAFPDEDMPGIDVVIPDFTYVRENIHKLRGVFLTHGHEDHIGAIPWLCREIKVPVYGNRLTLALVRQKLDDRGTGSKGVKLIEIRDGETQAAGCFEVEFIHTNHSIADANAFAIHTPAGIVFHSGDFKIDYTPINGTPIDLQRIAEIGAEGVLLMICESTNVERGGYTSSESKVGETLINLFDDATGRIFVTTFSSNVFRIQQIITAAERYNRKVVMIVRSMLNYFAAADSLGYLNYQPDTLIEIRDIDNYEANEILFITTGSQGEPMSALTRMAFAEHRQVEILPGDTVILSSSAIPGNEKPIYRVINELYKRGAHVIYESLSEIHVSGHAYREELKILHSLLRPRYFIPNHGEYRHQFIHAELANSLGMRRDHIFILDNGDVFEYNAARDSAEISGFVQTGGVLIDGSGIGDIDAVVLRDRLLLADDGVVVVSVAINRSTGELIGEPNIQARGFIYEIENQRITSEMAKKVEDMVRKAGNSGKAVREALDSDAARNQLQKMLYGKTHRRPMILISILEV
jgi:ribonuclease J